MWGSVETYFHTVGLQGCAQQMGDRAFAVRTAHVDTGKLLLGLAQNRQQRPDIREILLEGSATHPLVHRQLLVQELKRFFIVQA